MSIIGGLVGYLRDTRGELKHVSWPSRKQTISFTVIVIVLSITTGVFLGVLDFGFGRLLARFI